MRVDVIRESTIQQNNNTNPPLPLPSIASLRSAKFLVKLSNREQTRAELLPSLYLSHRHPHRARQSSNL